MRVLVGAFGTRGDVQPMLALAQELSRRGHDIDLAAPPSSVELARSLGLSPTSVGINYEEISRRSANGTFREALELMPLVRGEVHAQLAALEERASSADVLVGSTVFTVGTVLSEKLGKPFAFFAFCPQMFPSAKHPSPAIPAQTLPPWLNRLSWGVNEWLWARILKSTLNRVRSDRGLFPVRQVWPSIIGQHPVVASDPTLAQAPEDHPTRIEQVGALVLGERRELSPALVEFLERGPAPVYIGFGSMADPNPTATTGRLLESVRQAKVRAVVFRGWAGLEQREASKDVLFVGEEPHGKLFPRCAAVVHHGGAGTTHAAARAGIPQVVMPQLLDQNFWAHRVWMLGLGPKHVPRHGKDPALLASALRACLDDRAMRERARTFSQELIPNGVERAASLVERLATREPYGAYRNTAPLSPTPKS